VKAAAKKPAKPAAKAKAPAKAKPVAKKAAAKAPAKKVAKAAVKKAAPKKAVAKKTTKPVAKAKAPAKKVSAKTAVKKAAPKKAVAKKVAKPAPKAPAKKVAAKAPAPKKPVAKAPAKVVANVVPAKPAPKPAPVKAEIKPTPKPVVPAPKAEKPAPAPKPVKKDVKKTDKEPTKPAAKQPLVTQVVAPNRPMSAPVVKKHVSTLESADKLRYSDDELAEFKDLIMRKLDEARKDYDLLKQTLANNDNNGTDDTSPSFKMIEDGSETLSREETAQLASRQEKFIKHLEDALLRIRNKTYGICRVTGRLISKERLRLVPHATLSIEAKQQMNG